MGCERECSSEEGLLEDAADEPDHQNEADTAGKLSQGHGCFSKNRRRQVIIITILYTVLVMFLS